MAMNEPTPDPQAWDNWRIEDEMEKEWKRHGETYQYLWVRELCRRICHDQDATIKQLEADADVAETKFQQQSMILEQQAAEIKRLRAQLAAAQQQEAMPVPVWEPVEDGEYEGQHKHHTIYVDGEWLTISEPYWRTMDDEEPSFEESTIALDDDLRLCRRALAAQPKQGEE